MNPDMWSYRAESFADEPTSIAGYDVDAADGRIGSVDEATYEIGGSYLVIDTGGWIFGTKVMLPAGTIERIDHQQRKVYVARPGRDQAGARVRRADRDGPRVPPAAWRVLRPAGLGR